MKRLPLDYANVADKYSIGKDDNLIVPKISKHIDSFEGSVSHLISEEYAWLKNSLQLLLNESLEKSDWLSWAAFHASHNITNFVTRMISHVMPILLQKSSDPATIAHVLRIACGLIKHLNPGQIVMVETDQPLYQTTKKLQWKYPEEIFSEDRMFQSLGSLHTEKMLRQMSRDLQEGSGIVTAFSNSGIETFGTTTFLICNSITTTRYHKQVLVLALEILKNRAFNKYIEEQRNSAESTEDEDLLFETPIDFDLWIEKTRKEQPQAYYFSLCQEIDLCILELVRCCRIADLDGFTTILRALIPYVFALDHLHYSRNLPVFLRDLSSLKDHHPSLYEELKENGNFMGRKTEHRFSSMPIDQSTEQAVWWLKNEGRVIGNLDNPQTVRRHQASIPEMARIIWEFEGDDDNDNDLHHEMFPKFQHDFKKNVLGLVDSFEKLGNPWSETSGLLYDLNESIVMPDEVVQNIRSLKKTGEERFRKFLDLRINSQVEAFTDTVSHTNLMLFKKALET